MKLITPSADELLNLREDPLLVEQELDVRPDVAQAIEKALGIRSGRIYWRSGHEYLYALELADLGKDRPSSATVYGFWDRYEPRPPEHEIDADLLDFLTWFAGLTGGSINPQDILKVAEFTRQQTGCCQTTWPAGSVLRTPEERFTDLPGFDYPPRYTEIEGLQMAYYETGTGQPILCLHGEPTWAYLYRRMMPILSQAGRVIVPDLIGFGRSDKPVAENSYSYKSHVRWMKKFLTALDLQDITVIAQDWGGSIGLRLVAEMPERFRRIIMMNTGIANGMSPGQAFLTWRRFSQDQVFLDVPVLIKATLQHALSESEYAAYGAPFPSKEYGRGNLVFPRLVPVRPDYPGTYDNQMAIEKLKELDVPVLLFWGDKDDITKTGLYFLKHIFKKANEPVIIKGAGHFIQEDAGEEVAGKIVEWMKSE
jgi:haloalkane dehalogenase